MKVKGAAQWWSGKYGEVEIPRFDDGFGVEAKSSDEEAGGRSSAVTPVGPVAKHGIDQGGNCGEPWTW